MSEQWHLRQWRDGEEAGEAQGKRCLLPSSVELPSLMASPKLRPREFA